MTWTQAEIKTGHFRLDNQCGSPTTKLIMIIDNEKFESVSHDRNLVLKLREGLKKQKRWIYPQLGGWVETKSTKNMPLM